MTPFCNLFMERPSYYITYALYCVPPEQSKLLWMAAAFTFYGAAGRNLWRLVCVCVCVRVCIIYNLYGHSTSTSYLTETCYVFRQTTYKVDT